MKFNDVLSRPEEIMNVKDSVTVVTSVFTQTATGGVLQKKLFLTISQLRTPISKDQRTSANDYFCI